MVFPKIEESITEKVEIDGLLNNLESALKKVSFTTNCNAVKNNTFTKCLFSYTKLRNIKFQNCKFENCQFNGTIFEDCEFHKCLFINCNFYKAQVKTTYLDPTSFSFSSEWYKKWSNINAWWFQSLFRNSKQMHQEEFAMVADKKFQFYRRYDYLLGIKKRPFRFLGGLFYDMALGYGYGVWNAIITTCIFIAFFAALMAPQTSLKDNASPLESIYFSVVSFTTVGYGEITPAANTTALVITTTFLFLSVLWGSIVTAVIVKRLVK
jgi:hypothetical protein